MPNYPFEPLAVAMPNKNPAEAGFDFTLKKLTLVTVTRHQ